MEHKITLVNTLTPDTISWVARVCVVSKTTPRIAQKGLLRFQKMLLADEKGNRVEAMMHREDIDLFKNSFEVNKTCIISNAIVKPVKEDFKNLLVSNNYYWIKGGRTAVLPSENNLISPVFAPKFMDYNRFHELIGTRTLIRVSLSSTTTSIVQIDSKDGRFTELQIWKTANENNIDQLVKQGGFFEEKIIDIAAHHIQIMSVIDVVKAKELGNFDISVKGNVANANQKFFYACCEECITGTSADIGYLFKCHSCDKDRTAKPRYNFCLNVFYDSGEIEVTLFANDAEKIMGMPASEFHKISADGDYFPIGEIKSRLQKMMLKMRIRSKIFKRRNGIETKEYIVQVLECYDADSEEKLLPYSPRGSDYQSTSSSHQSSNKSRLPFESFPVATIPPLELSGMAVENITTGINYKKHHVDKGKSKELSGDARVDHGSSLGDHATEQISEVLPTKPRRSLIKSFLCEPEKKKQIVLKRNAKSSVGAARTVETLGQEVIEESSDGELQVKKSMLGCTLKF